MLLQGCHVRRRAGTTRRNKRTGLEFEQRVVQGVWPLELVREGGGLARDLGRDSERVLDRGEEELGRDGVRVEGSVDRHEMRRESGRERISGWRVLSVLKTLTGRGSGSGCCCVEPEVTNVSSTAHNGSNKRTNSGHPSALVVVKEVDVLHEPGMHEGVRR